MQALADAEQVAGPTMSKIVGALEADGLVRRVPDPADARGDPVGDCRAGA